ncbi:MAG TPA: hypothetical protein VFT22_01325, partial [Kofleriaceae bacterium]|nr:hypothetical protein [Kofleriaceae bacterium]
LDSVSHDEVTMRVRCYWGSVVAGPETRVAAWRETSRALVGDDGARGVAVTVTVPAIGEVEPIAVDEESRLPATDLTLEVTAEGVGPERRAQT